METEAQRLSPVINDCIAVSSEKGGDDYDDNDGEDDFVFEIDNSTVEECEYDECQCPHIGTHGMAHAGPTENNDDDDGKIEAAMHEVFQSQIIIESLMVTNPENTSTEATHLPEYRCEDLPNFMFSHEGGEPPNNNMLVDTHIMLVGDDSSVCLPCQTTHGKSGAGTICNPENPSHNQP